MTCWHRISGQQESGGGVCQRTGLFPRVNAGLPRPASRTARLTCPAMPDGRSPSWCHRVESETASTDSSVTDGRKYQPWVRSSFRAVVAGPPYGLRDGMGGGRRRTSSPRRRRRNRRGVPKSTTPVTVSHPPRHDAPAPPRTRAPRPGSPGGAPRAVRTWPRPGAPCGAGPTLAVALAQRHGPAVSAEQMRGLCDLGKASLLVGMP